MRDPVFPVFCAMGVVLCAVPLPWHWEARNTSTLLYLGWTITGCIVFLVDSLVWAGNTNDVAPVWCDISTRLILGLSVGLPATSMCVQRRLHRVATYNKATSIQDSWKREMIIDILISIGLPALVMALFYVVQTSRYVIVEDIGCWPSMHSSLLKIPMVMIWPVLIGSVSFIYAVLTIRAFIKSRRQFSMVLSDSGDGLSMSRYFRLMALAGTDMAFSLPISLYELVHSLLAYPSPPWVSWNDTHEYIHEVGIRTYEGILAIPGHKTAYDINRWAIPGCAFLFFAFFGLSGEAMKRYKKTFWRVIAPFGIRPPAPGSSPEHQTASWPRRMAARITGSDRDHHTTFSSEVGTGNHDAGELGVDQAPRLDDALDAKSQNSAKIEIEDLESQK